MLWMQRMGHAPFEGVFAQQETGWASRMPWRMRRGPRGFDTGLAPDIAGIKGCRQFSLKS